MLILQLAFAMELLAKLTTLLSAALSGLKIATGDQRDYDRFSAMKSEYDLQVILPVADASCLFRLFDQAWKARDYLSTASGRIHRRSGGYGLHLSRWYWHRMLPLSSNETIFNHNITLFKRTIKKLWKLKSLIPQKVQQHWNPVTMSVVSRMHFW